MQDFQTIAHLIPNFGDRVDDPPATITDQTTLQAIFLELLGQSSDFIQPVLFRSGRLVVYAQAAIWGQHIQHRHDRIMRRCVSAGLFATEIKVKVLPDLLSCGDNEMPRAATYDGEKASIQVDMLANQLNETPLKNSLNRLAERIRDNHNKRNEP